MTFVRHRTSAAFAALSALTLISSAGAQLSKQPYHYSYFKESVPLRLDLSQLAITQNNPERADQLDPRLAAFELSTSKSLAARNLIAAQTPLWAREDATLKDMARAIATERAADFVSPVFLDASNNPLYITSGLIVGFPENTNPDKARAFLAALVPGADITADYASMKGVYRLRTTMRNGFDVLNLANTIAANPIVSFAEPELILTATHSVVPNDTLFNDLWGMRNTGQFGCCSGEDLKLTQAWDISQGNPNIIVMVLDNGVQQNHPDLNQIAGDDFTTFPVVNGGPGNACDNHGTTVAGCISAIINNWTGVTGVAPACKVVSARYIIADTPCNNQGLFYTTGLVEALDWGLTIGVDITVNSNAFPASAVVTNKYNDTRNQNLLIHFASSGNDNASSLSYPASLNSVNAVGAVGPNGLRASFSNFGAGIDFVAPGVSIRTTDRANISGFVNGDYVLLNGTSYAAPYAAGVAALILSINPDLPPNFVESIMQESALDKGTTGYDTTYGYGLVNAYQAVLSTPPPVLPGAFNLTTPANGATGVSTTPTFDWSDATNALSYRVIIDNDSNFSSPLFNDLVSNSQLVSTPNSFTPGVTYYWKVEANNFTGTTSSTPVSASFTVGAAPPPAPGAFSLLSPTNNATGVSRNPFLDWSDSTNASQYAVTIDTDAAFNPPHTLNINTNVSNYQVAADFLNTNTQYFWRVVASNVSANTASSPASASFTTIAPPPACPGDANNDRQVTGADLSVLLANFGTSVPVGTSGDFNKDGIVSGADLSVLLANFGSAC